MTFKMLVGVHLGVAAVGTTLTVTVPWWPVWVVVEVAKTAAT